MKPQFEFFIGLIFATMLAFTLPKVDNSLYFHTFDDVQPTAAVNSSPTELHEAKSIKSQAKKM